MWASEAAAQQGTLHGVVTDSAGTPLSAADVGVVAVRQLARTDDSGRFVVRKLPRGQVELSVRRLGFLPRTVQVDITHSGVDSVRVALARDAVLLESIEVSAFEHRRRVWIEEFHRRRMRGVGNFITREEIVARHSFTPSDMFRNTPGVRLIRTRSGRGVRFNYTTSLDARRDCAPMIWVDGQRAPGMEIDDLPLTDIEGIEIYSGPATTPMQFSQSLTTHLTCGTIVVWSRPPNSRTP